MKEQIIDYIKRNRVSSTEVADCLSKNGSVPGVQAINRGHFKVGNVFWVYAYGGTNWDVHKQIEHVNDGDIVLVETFNCEDKAIFGDLVSKYLVLYKQVSAIVVTGSLRDAPRLIKENWPIWCTGFNPIGCVNEELSDTLDPAIINVSHEKYHGSIAVCDDTGVVIIPKEMHNCEFINKLEEIEEQEDLWFECIDRKKLSTFETVCLRLYENGDA